jgi:hypothetical protein
MISVNNLPFCPFVDVTNLFTEPLFEGVEVEFYILEFFVVEHAFVVNLHLYFLGVLFLVEGHSYLVEDRIL